MRLWIKITLWSLFLIGVITAGVFIKDTLDNQILPAPEIIVHVDGENAFVTDTIISERLFRSRLLFDGQKRSELDVRAIENFVRDISQVKSADVFQKIDGSWKVDVYVRKPIARIFNSRGETFYMDDEGNTMSITPVHTARTLVVTGNIPDRKNSVSVPEIINNDSLISISRLDDIYRISNYVCNDPLFQSLIGQVHLTKKGDFVLIPLVGDQKIIFGSAYSEKEVKEKFQKLRIFYKEALPYEGWDTYTEISLKFDDQIVCKKKETNE